MSRNKEHRPNGAAAEGGASVFFVSAHLSFYIMNIYGNSLYILYIFHIYVLNIFRICPLVCLLIYGVNRRQVLRAKPLLFGGCQE